MSDVPSDVLLEIFRLLDLKERVTQRRVCTRWFNETHDSSLWNLIVLDEENCSEWSPSILDLFDTVTFSNLKQLKIEISIPREHMDHLISTLQKSKATLKLLHLDVLGLDVINRNKVSDLVWALPNLVEFMIPSHNQFVHLSIDQEVRGTTELKSLIAWGGPQIWKNYFIIFKNLSCLVIHYARSRFEWREMLEGCATTLKHLDVKFEEPSEGEEDSYPKPLLFPSLVNWRCNSDTETKWVCPPLLELYVCAGTSIPPLSATIKDLWIQNWFWDPEEYYHLHDLYPSLKALRIHSKEYESEALVLYVKALVFILRSRRESADKGVEIEGFRMCPIQQLVIQDHLYQEANEDQRAEFDRVEDLIIEDFNGFISLKLCI